MLLENQKVTSVHDAYQLLAGKMQNWLTTIVSLLPNFIVAVVVLILFFFLARMMRKLSHKLLSHLSNKTIEILIGNVVFTVLLLTGVFIALGILNLDKTVTSLLAGAGIIGLALSFAFQDLAQNFISGVSLAVRRPFAVGDTIEVNNKRGIVQALNLRTTELLNSSGEAVFIPNKEVFQNALINSSKGETVRVRIMMEFLHKHTLDDIEQKIIQTLGRNNKILKDSVTVLYTEVTFQFTKAEIRFSVNRGENDAAIKSEAIKAIDLLFKPPIS